MNPFHSLSDDKTLSIMFTFQCTAECNYCGTLSSPRERTRLSLKDVLQAIEEAAVEGIKVVVFTGGETTLLINELIIGIKKAKEKGLVTRIVTNAYWATTEKAADEMIKKLIGAGLNEINFSTGDEHVRFVPLRNIIRASKASAENGLDMFIMIESKKHRKVTKKTLEEDPDFINIRKKFPKVAIVVEESPWMPLSSEIIQDYSEKMLLNEQSLPLRTGCDSVLTTPTLEANGDIYACCGIGSRLIPELKVGSIKDSSIHEAMETAESDFLKQWLKIEGPEKILAWAAKYDSEIKWENMYSHKCQACIRLYSDPKVRDVIRKHYKEKLLDVFFNKSLLYSYNYH